ncbi:DUF4395 domain-containing protein [Microbacterium luticocti]|uniref:DUF4395 domain-containing protein n=1 Tax=Microbacterium luticocti TaxID=451764 RepID=UPI0004027A9E|nr:DUF4395 domain-containing protein [Microbacterium luticocti]
MSEIPGIDPRGPRFAAAITSALLLVTVVLGLVWTPAAEPASFGWFAYQPLAGDAFFPGALLLMYTPLWARILDPAFLLLLVVAALFLWGVAWPRTAPWGVLFRRMVRPRLSPPAELEDPRPPRFAQGIGLLVSVVGLALQLLGVPWGLPIAAAVAFVAAFLNAAFRFCLGCQVYLLLQRAGLVGRAAG